MKPAERPATKRRPWNLSADELHDLHALAFGKECKRPLKISQGLLVKLLLDFNRMCTNTEPTECENPNQD